MEKFVNLYDITFCLVDEDGNYIEQPNGQIEVFKLKDGIRYKPLEHICDGIDPDMLERIEN